MARILAISSQVAHGHVGLSAIVPALHALGHEAIALPTVLLSNHPGHANVAGSPIDPGLLTRMIDALGANGWLGQIDVILSGYLPSVAHVEFVAATVARVRQLRPTCRYLCDPVLGDDPKGLYIDKDAASAICQLLLPLADVILPNRFELAWLSNEPVTSPVEAVCAARSLGVATVIATSIPSATGSLLTMQIDANRAIACEVARRTSVPNGTGDLLSALIAGGWNLGRAVAAIDALLDESAGFDELRLTTSTRAWMTASPVAEPTVDYVQPKAAPCR
jgi:pyridoxine kinase